MQLEILYEDDHIVAINKPHGLLVHRTKIAADATQFALQILRDQLDQKVYPAHRLDRKTAGVLIFSKDKVTDSAIQKLFMNHQVEKTYLAIVRGWVPDSQSIDYAVGEGDKRKAAITEYRCLQRYEIDIPLGKHESSRYSMIELRPKTGRFHQIRKHMAHIRHPIVGDRPHGCSKQNRMWKKKFQMETMMLHASAVRLDMGGKQNIDIQAPIGNEFKRVLNILKMNEWN